jgi:long-subunit acyl-CoA synthetase (AMP-forming)
MTTATETAHEIVSRYAEEMPDREFLHQPVDGELHVTTFSEAVDRAQRMASALLDLGLSPGDKVAILGKNSAEWILADLGIAMAGMISVPIYPTAGTDTIRFVFGHAEVKAVFVGKLDDPENVAEAIPDTIPTIAFPYPTVACRFDWQQLIEDSEPISQANKPAKEDAMTILYTSGSTGRPKGVVISYGAYHYGCQAAGETVGVQFTDRVLSYLPLAHVTERMVIIGPSIFAGARIFFVESLDTFTRDTKIARPTAFGSVPRLWVKFQAGILAKISPAKLRTLLAIPIIRGKVAHKIRQGLGLDHCEFFGSGSAPISTHTINWYRKIGVDIGEGWGMTETSGLSCTNMPFQALRVGTIGVPVSGTELKISEAGELLIRCPGLFTEYYKQPELTRESFTDDGFFRTGDKASWDEARDGYCITGRVKDIFKSAKGKYIVPVPIESQLSANPLLEQVCVIGSGLPAPVAVVVLGDAAKQLPRKSVEDSLEATRVATNAMLESHERLSNMFVAKEEWTTENGLLTPTLKVRREQLEARYLGALDRTFSSSVVWEAND